MRVGLGYDIHRLGAERPLVLGGVRFPGEPGLYGHSDADPVMHAVADALLGAAALGDIGEHFPDTSLQWEGADSRIILERSLAIVREQSGLTPRSVDVNIIAERPRIGKRKVQMREHLAEALRLPLSAVSVKARSAEGLGPVGRAEAIEVQAVAVLDRPSPGAG